MENIKSTFLSSLMNEYLDKAQDAGCGMYNFDFSKLGEFRKDSTYGHRPYEDFILQTYEKGNENYGMVWLLCYYEESKDHWDNDCFDFKDMTPEEQNTIVNLFKQTYGDFKPKTYHLNIFESEVELPDYLDIEYKSLDDAVSILGRFVHSFDGKGIRVNGRILNKDGEDIEYMEAIPELPKKTYRVYVRIGGYACQDVEASSPEEAERIAIEHKDDMGDRDYCWWDEKKGVGNLVSDLLECFPDERKVVRVEEI